jgi:hypothetical protein
MSTTYQPTLPPILEEEEEQPQVIFPPNNSKKNRRKWKRHLKRTQRAYFKDAVENKTWELDQFLDDIYDWYFA